MAKKTVSMFITEFIKERNELSKTVYEITKEITNIRNELKKRTENEIAYLNQLNNNLKLIQANYRILPAHIKANRGIEAKKTMINIGHLIKSTKKLINNIKSLISSEEVKACDRERKIKKILKHVTDEEFVIYNKLDKAMEILNGKLNKIFENTAKARELLKKKSLEEEDVRFLESFEAKPEKVKV